MRYPPSEPVALVARSSASSRWAPGAILLLAAALRLVGLRSNSFFQDELYTVEEATNLFHSTAQPGIWARPFYYVVQHMLLALAPPTPLALRLLPFVLGVLGVWLTWLVGKRVLGEVAGLVAAFLLAITPWHLFVSGMARYWSLVYVLAALGYLALHQAEQLGRTRDCVLAVVVWTVAAATHPTALFPLPGVVLALRLVGPDGGLAWHWPSRRAWQTLWLPLALSLLAEYTALALSGHQAHLRNFYGRGSLATLRLVPAMVEWMTPTAFTLGVVGALGLALLGSLPERRRWGLMAVLGCGSAMTLLVVASTVTDVYPLYGMAMLPLLFVSAGALVQLGCEAMSARRGLFAGVATVTLAAGIVPSTVSHLSDGSRFDYRPAFQFIRTHGSDVPVVTWPIVLQRYYAPDLRAYDLSSDTVGLHSFHTQHQDLWAVVSVQRYGVVMDDRGDLAAWLLRHCRLAFSHQRPRLDYRLYRVDLYRCRADSLLR
ncbi:MAG: hypothetical protein AUH78_05220 [Gemmatimonadetes bacterium 13_1_40CM_4_69_8]|nr:MAG: hypothetical protein AUH78_05220 [Gemmatimonadetes bacterium 13_1_40CM_4_69_8]